MGLPYIYIYAAYIDPSCTTPGLIGSPMAVPLVVSGCGGSAFALQRHNATYSLHRGVQYGDPQVICVEYSIGGPLEGAGAGMRSVCFFKGQCRHRCHTWEFGHP